MTRAGSGCKSLFSADCIASLAAGFRIVIFSFLAPGDGRKHGTVRRDKSASSSSLKPGTEVVNKPISPSIRRKVRTGSEGGEERGGALTWREGLLLEGGGC